MKTVSEFLCLACHGTPETPATLGHVQCPGNGFCVPNVQRVPVGAIGMLRVGSWPCVQQGYGAAKCLRLPVTSSTFASKRAVSSNGLLQSGDVIVHVLLISIAKIMKFIKRVISFIIITVIRHGMGHI